MNVEDALIDYMAAFKDLDTYNKRIEVLRSVLELSEIITELSKQDCVNLSKFDGYKSPQISKEITEDEYLEILLSNIEKTKYNIGEYFEKML